MSRALSVSQLRRRAQAKRVIAAKCREAAEVVNPSLARQLEKVAVRRDREADADDIAADRLEMMCTQVTP